ncbi:tetratricopeptide repeat protein [Aquimarina sp. Aq78]|uniref:tetratricopeptide repeat protein n=1 Tax=Aquimarina sp. Aq78 TaxID=1191889 RepID=UPI000D0FB67E|nr:tetratricopeptide repeat protein [Aquimarina sp. Aq78]
MTFGKKISFLLQYLNILYLLILCNINNAYSQKIISTTGENSPSIIAKKISINYGVRTKTVEELLKIYEKQGVSQKKREDKVNSLLEKYKNIISRKKIIKESEIDQLGIKKKSEILNILNWDIFLSTTGQNSPAIYSPESNVEIWYGISPKAFLAIYQTLENQKLESYSSRTQMNIFRKQAINFEQQLTELIEKYKVLKHKLSLRSSFEEMARKVKILLDEGEILEAERILENDALNRNKSSALRNFEVGKIKEINLKYKEATKYYLIASTLEEQNWEYSMAYIDKLFDNGLYSKCAKQIKKSEKFLSKKDSLYEKKSRIFNRYLGMTGLFLEKYDEAIIYFNKYLNLKNIDDIDSLNLAASYHNLGQVYYMKRSFNQAIVYHNKSLEIVENINPNKKGKYENILEGGIYIGLGNAYSEIDSINKAMKHYDKSLKIHLKNVTTEHPRLGEVYSNIGDFYLRIRLLEKAEEYLNKSLEIYHNVYGNQYVKLHNVYYNLGVLYSLKGNQLKALDFLNKSLKIRLNELGEKHPKIPITYSTISGIYIKKNDPVKALEYHNKSIEIYLKIAGAQSYYDIIVKNNVQWFIYSRTKSYRLALKPLKKNLNIYLEVFGNQHVLLEELYYVIGVTYFQKNRLENAIDFFEKSLKVYSKNNKHYNKVVSQIYTFLGNIYIKKKMLDKAIDSFEKSLKIDLRIHGNQHSDIKVKTEYLNILKTKKL